MWRADGRQADRARHVGEKLHTRIPELWNYSEHFREGETGDTAYQPSFLKTPFSDRPFADYYARTLEELKADDTGEELDDALSDYLFFPLETRVSDDARDSRLWVTRAIGVKVATTRLVKRQPSYGLGLLDARTRYVLAHVFDGTDRKPHNWSEFALAYLSPGAGECLGDGGAAAPESRLERADPGPGRRSAGHAAHASRRPVAFESPDQPVESVGVTSSSRATSLTDNPSARPSRNCFPFWRRPVSSTTHCSAPPCAACECGFPREWVASIGRTKVLPRPGRWRGGWRGRRRRS